MEEIKVLIDEKTLQNKIKEIAENIMQEYKEKEITLICILKGSMYFTVDLSKYIKNKLKIEVIKVSSYGNEKESSGKINMELNLKESIEGKDVIVVEDIIDTGRTLSYLLDYLRLKNPNSIKLCTLLNKPERRVFDVKVDYNGFSIPDKFVVGYGLDYSEYYRNLPYIGYIE